MSFKVDDIVEVKRFSFYNKAGGTGLSDWQYDIKYTGKEAKVKITKVWWDYECGYRAWAEAISEELKEYMELVANDKDKRIFVGEFDVKD